MDKFEHYKQQLDKDLADETKPWSKYLKLAEEKTGVNRSYIFLGEFIQKKKIIAILYQRRKDNSLFFTCYHDRK